MVFFFFAEQISLRQRNQTLQNFQTSIRKFYGKFIIINILNNKQVTFNIFINNIEKLEIGANLLCLSITGFC